MSPHKYFKVTPNVWKILCKKSCHTEEKSTDLILFVLILNLGPHIQQNSVRRTSILFIENATIKIAGYLYVTFKT